MEAAEQVVRPKRMNDKNEELTLKWSDIKSFCDTLTPEQLSQNVVVWGDYKGGGIYSIAIANDDLINPSGDGVEPKSLYEDEDDFDVNDETIVMNKGQIILELDF